MSKTKVKEFWEKNKDTIKVIAILTVDCLVTAFVCYRSGFKNGVILGTYETIDRLSK